MNSMSRCLDCADDNGKGWR